jgi:hypothetical protein
VKYKITADPKYKSVIGSTSGTLAVALGKSKFAEVKGTFVILGTSTCNVWLRLTCSRSANGALNTVFAWVLPSYPPECHYKNQFTLKNPAPVPGSKSGCTATAEAMVADVVTAKFAVVATATCC